MRARHKLKINFEADRISKDPASGIKSIRVPLLKRPLDLILSGIGLLLSAPLWGITVLAIKLEDGGPIFFTQERWGKDGKRFKVRKFRTMIANADSLFGNQPAREDDQRITRIGKTLRATGLDELPQLFHVWKGEMSLVGPRALAVDEIIFDENGRAISLEKISGFWERLVVRPGLTSIATIYRARDIHPKRKFRYDLFYVRHISFCLDVRLIMLSLWISIRGNWEKRGKKY